MEIGIIYVIPIVAIGLAILGWLILERFSGGRVEAEIKRDKERIDNLADSVKHCTDSVTECEGTTERITETEQRTENKISVASESVGEAKQSGNRIECLADECLSILEEAEKTEE